MGSLPKFARVEIEIEGGGTPTQPPPAPTPSIIPRKNKRKISSGSFGAIDMDSIGIAKYERPQPFVPKPQETPTRQNIEAVKVAAQATRPSKQRISKPKMAKTSKPKMTAAVVAQPTDKKVTEAITVPRVEFTRPPERPTRESMEAVKIAEDETRIAKAGASDVAKDRAEALARRIDAALADEASGEAPVPVPSQGADRVAVMRELYAQGDADAALVIAKGMELEADDDFPIARDVSVEIAGTADFDLDELDASSDLGQPIDLAGTGFGDELDDPFGGLIPLEEDDPGDDAPIVVTKSGPKELKEKKSAGAKRSKSKELKAAEPAAFGQPSALVGELVALEPEPMRDSELPPSSEPDPFGGLIPAGDLEVPENIVASTARIPRLLISPKEISKLPVDPRAAFILGHVDGIQSIEEILDVCAMPAPEAVDLIEKLRSMGVITLS